MIKGAGWIDEKKKKKEADDGGFFGFKSSIRE